MSDRENLEWIEPKSIIEAKQIIAIYQQEISEIVGQIATRKILPTTQRMPTKDYEDYLRWRASAIKAKGHKEVVVRRLRLWVSTQGQREHEEQKQKARSNDSPQALEDLREAKYYLHRLVEEGELTSEIMQRIVTFLRKG